MTREAFWRAHLRLIAWCLLVWFVVSFGCGILLRDALNQYDFFGVPLGFWFAQQGAIYVFVVLIPFYTWRINRLEKRFHASASQSA